MFLFIYLLCVHMSTQMPCHVHGGMWTTCESEFFPSRVLMGSYSGFLACQQAPLPNEPSHQPKFGI